MLVNGRRSGNEGVGRTITFTPTGTVLIASEVLRRRTDSVVEVNLRFERAVWRLAEGTCEALSNERPSDTLLDLALRLRCRWLDPATCRTQRLQDRSILPYPTSVLMTFEVTLPRATAMQSQRPRPRPSNFNASRARDACCIQKVLLLPHSVKQLIHRLDQFKDRCGVRASKMRQFISDLGDFEADIYGGNLP